MKPNPVRLGIIGCGDISHAHGGAASAIPRQARFTACCDIRHEVAEAWATRYGATAVYRDYGEMIQREELDGILLATWPNQHREQIELALQAGARAILCEKALTLTGREAVEIYDLVTRADAFLMEGFMYRHHPAMRMMEQLVAQGAIGNVDNVRGEFSAFDAETQASSDTTRNWRQRRECGGGVPYDFACYAVNACGAFCGGVPTRVNAVGGVSAAYDTVNRLFGIIEYSTGQIGFISSSKQTHFSQELQVEGGGGSLFLPLAWTIYDNAVIERRYTEGWAQLRTETYRITKADAYQRQLENFAAVIRGEATPVMPLAQSVVNAFVVEALVTSLLERQPVEITIPDHIRDAVAKETRR